ncbi:MAG: hypothetical protein WC238_05410 [Parcubacteria group bacterium]|jgi:hypothetical protein
MDFITIYLTLQKELVNFYHSSGFLVVKFLVGIYVLIVFIDLVLLVVQRGVGANIRQMRYGMNIPSELVSKKSKMKARWDKVKKRLEVGSEAECKVAIIEADDIIDDLIARMGYKGNNMAERLANIPDGQLNELGEIKEAHEIRNRVIHEEDLVVDKEFAQDVLRKYEHLLRHFEVLD